MNRHAFLESKALHTILVSVGTVMLLIALLQLPVSIFFQNTRPGFPWITKRITSEGLLVAPIIADKDTLKTVILKDDIITHLNGIPVDSSSVEQMVLVEIASNARIGDTLRIDLLRHGRKTSVDIVLNQSRAEIYGIYVALTSYLFHIIAPLVTMLIAFIIILKRPSTIQATLYFLLSFSISFYLLTSSTISQFMPWWQVFRPVMYYLHEISFTMFFPFLLHFLVVFPEEQYMKKTPLLRNSLIYIPYILLLATYFLAKYYYSSSSLIVFDYISYVLFFLSPFVGVALLILSYRNTSSPTTRKVILTILTGLIIYGISVGAIFSISVFQLLSHVSFTLSLAIRTSILLFVTFSLPLAFGYAILRYGFLDVRILFKRTTVYAILAVIVVVFFIGIYILLETFFNAFGRHDILIISVIVTGVLSIGLTMVKERIQKFVDKRLFKEEFRISHELQILSRKMLNFLDRNTLLEALTKDLPSILQINSVSIATLTLDGRIMHVAGNTLPLDHMETLVKEPEFLNSLSEEKIIIVNSFSGITHCSNVNVIFPIALQNGTYVSVILGEKISGNPLTVDELALLRSVADHASLGWKNAVLSEDMQAQESLKKEIEIAHTIQSAMLPMSIPVLSGIEIAAITSPAHEIGGDFFDFLRIDSERIGIVVGDVSDKGVSAAMVMASSISTIRFAAERETDPKDILALANKRIFQDTHRKMFVAVFLGVIEVPSLTIKFTNAGLPKPLLQRGSETYLLEWSENGHHFPLGTQADISFHEQTLTMVRGDILVLYTDGVIESNNIDDEEFGVKRLRDVVRNSKHLSAEDIKAEIFKEISAFTGRTLLFDDLTLVVLKIL